MNNFNGFPTEMTDFVWELRFNNNKEWMDNNRDRYEAYFKKPMELFAADMSKYLSELFGREVFYNISRINRDIRYSKNKMPYRDNRWVVFKFGQGRWQDMPCMFFDLYPEKWQVGLGFYNGNADFMAKFRQRVDSKTTEFTRIVNALDKHPEFELWGDMYKRPIGKEHKETVMKYYNRKNVAVVEEREIGREIYSREIFDEVCAGFKILKPLQEFLNTISV